MAAQASSPPKRSEGTKVFIIVALVLAGCLLLFSALVMMLPKNKQGLASSAQPSPSPLRQFDYSPSSTSGVTMDNYNRLKIGMSYSETCRILGKNGTELSRNEMAMILLFFIGIGLVFLSSMFLAGVGAALQGITR